MHAHTYSYTRLRKTIEIVMKKKKTCVVAKGSEGREINKWSSWWEGVGEQSGRFCNGHHTASHTGKTHRMHGTKTEC